MIRIILSVVVFVVLSGILGVLIGICSKAFAVDSDPRNETILTMLPNANCGGCGFPGCSGFETALVEGKAKAVSQCRPSKPEAREKIKTYLAETPGPDGNTINVGL